MKFKLSIVSGRHSLASQYHALINPDTCNKYHLGMEGYINLNRDKKSLVVHFRADDNVLKESIMINPKTHAMTLNVAHDDIVMCEKISETPQSTKISVRLRKNGSLINYPNLKEALYLSQGYYIICPEGIGIVEQGEGIYTYNQKNIMSELLKSGTSKQY